MKTSNKLLLGLLIAIIIVVTVNIVLVKSALIKEIDNHTEQKIENIN